MVAKSGSGWKLTRSLISLFDEADRRWPRRNRASDGSIGDRAHSTRASDHNPNPAGFVTAGDLTHDPVNGPDAHAWADELRRRRDARISYVISAGRIFASYNTAGRPPWTWGRYTGSNTHQHHVHVSVLNTPVGRDITAPCFIPPVVPSAPPPALKIPDRPYPGLARLGDGMPPHAPSDTVGAWQQALAERGYPLRVDGRFGEQTYTYVVDWQRRSGLDDDGIAGPATWHAVLFN